MALARFETDFTDETTGKKITTAGSVEVRNDDTGELTNVYSDRNGTSALANPIPVADGNVAFHVIGGAYKIIATYGAQVRTLRYVAIGTAGEYDADALGRAGYAYGFESETSAPPSTSSIRANNADLSAATKLYIDDETLGLSDISATLLALDPDGNTTKNRVRLTVDSVDAVFDITGATDQTDYVELDVNNHDGSTSLNVGTARVNIEWAGTDLADGTLTSAAKSAATIAKDEGFKTVALLLADTGLTYTTSQSGTVAEGDIVWAQGFSYTVAASGASDHHIVNSNGTPVKFYCNPSENGYDLRQFGVVMGGAVDQSAAVNTVIQNTDIAPARFVIPAGELYVTGPIYAARSNFQLVGLGSGISKIKFVNASGGTVITGDSDEEASTTTYNYCLFDNFSIITTSHTTDPDTGVDITSFAYSEFNVQMQIKRANAVLYYGQGNNGSSPYYNVIKSPGLFGGDGAGGTNYTQAAIKFSQGALGDAVAGSNGGNANIIGPLNRVAAVAYLVDMEAGNGNMISHINGESVTGAYFRLNNNAYVENGTSTGSNAQNTLIDTSKSLTTNKYLNSAVQITGGTGSGQVRRIASNTATTYTVADPWAVVPDATSTYEVFAGKCVDNKITHVRTEGLATANPDFIHALPGVRATSFTHSIVGSLGSGLAIRDESGDLSNVWFSESKVVFTENIQNPGPSANIDVYAKNSVFGGVALYENYVINYLAVATTTASLSDTLTVSLDVGGTAAGNGDFTLQCVQPTGNTLSLSMAAATDRVAKSPASRRLFLNVTTGASFSASADVQVTWCATLV